MFDPVVNYGQSPVIDNFRADVRHSAGAQLRYSIEQHRTVRIARGEDVSIVDRKGALRGTNAKCFGLLEWRIETQIQVGGAPRSELMAMSTIRMNIGSGPLVKIRSRIEGVRQV